jgi:hypothetical protein
MTRKNRHVPIRECTQDAEQHHPDGQITEVGEMLVVCGSILVKHRAVERRNMRGDNHMVVAR